MSLLKRTLQDCLKKLCFYAKKYPIQFSITVAIILVHLTLLTYSAIKFYIPPEKQKPLRLRIQVVELEPQKTIPKPKIYPKDPPPPEPIAPEQPPEPSVPEPVSEPITPQPTPELAPPEPLPEPVTPPAPKPTVSPKPKVTKPTQKPKPAPKPEVVQKPIAKPAPKPEAVQKPIAKPKAKPASKPKPTAAPKPVVKQAPPPKKKETPQWSNTQKQLLKDIQGQVSSVRHETSTTPSKTTAVKVPDKIASLNVESNASPIEEFDDEEIQYQEQLVSHLRMLLRLPEKGEVHIELTLNRQGNIVRLTIKDANTQANKDYINHNLPSIPFPSFGSHFPGEKQHTFYITLTSQQ